MKDFSPIPVQWREYNWDTGYWDISRAFWASLESEGMLCVEAWTVGTSDWRSL